MLQVDVSPELKSRVRDYLKDQGYEVTEDTKITGKSGIEHTFDMLARRKDGISDHTLAICLATGGNREKEMATIFSFANKAYDTGITDRMLVAVSDLSTEARQLAQKQRIKVIDSKDVATLGKQGAQAPPKTDEPLKYETKSQLLQSLVNLGYRYEEKPQVTGKSGVTYTFDILAYMENGKVGRRLGIDFLTAANEVSLEQVSVFDTKAYDVGVDEKIIIASPTVSDAARKFAEQQRIKILELRIKQVPKPPVPKKPEPTKGKFGKQGKGEARTLRQAPDPEVLKLIHEGTARRYNAIPIRIVGNALEVAMVDPTDIFALEAFSAQSKKRIKPIQVDAKELREAIDFNYKAYGEIEKQISRISRTTDTSDDMLAISAAVDTPLVQALNLIIEEAVKARASDIHIEPEEDRLRVRYRIDGTLQDMMSLPLDIHRSIISRIKILSELNIADPHRPQDGQFSAAVKGREIDVRVATTPTVHGEMSVLRLLDKSLASLELEELGFLPDSMAQYESMLMVPYGMILISGPTGAGKTTTLYASVNKLDTITRNVVTIEDPAEYRFRDINQIQVNQQAGITFASGLRSILRLDPDVILVGEIRDAETANIAVQAALTGHLMLSSIHANETIGVLFRLLDLGVEPFLISSSIIGVVAQRMVRRICPDCNHSIEAPLMERVTYKKYTGEERTEFLYGTGCKTCSFTGYQGRTGIFEILTMTDTMKMMVASQAGSTDIRAQAIKEGMIPMIQDGMQKVQLGITTPTEVLRSTYTTEIATE